MFSSLYQKLAAVLLVLLFGVGAVGVVTTLLTTRRYLDEVEQKLDRKLAEHLLAEHRLFHDGKVDEEGLKHLFHRMMVINTRIEIYLLDPQGEILAFSAPPSRVKRQRVALGPLRAFLEGARLPLLGEDPRDPEGRKIFSVAPIPLPGSSPESGEILGYLYIVLAGEELESVAQMVQGSYILRLGLGVAVASLAAALVLGLFLFGLLTRRLKTLAATMQAFQGRGFTALPPTTDAPTAGPVATANRWGGDELDQLEETFQQMAERIVDQVEELKTTDRLRRELVANVSHDLRTPLASLQGYLETLLLKEGTLTPQEQRQYLEIAVCQSERLGKLVKELFELARLDAGARPLRPELFSLAELVQDVAQKFQLKAEDRKVSLKADLPRGASFVSADIRLMERVLENLMDNALAHTPGGGEVLVKVVPAEGRIKVTITDTGCGIPEDELPRIFERFYRGANGHGQDAGIGLGLAIVWRALELHDAELEVDSTVGTGTSFSFHLPDRSLDSAS